MRKAIQMGNCSWWRYTAYEVRAGFIRPCRGATIQEYDPWELFNEARYARGRRQTPYHTLINLVKRAAQWKNGEYDFRPDRRWEQEVGDWCSRYGLLGLLLAATRSLTLAPRWGRSLSFDPDKPEGEAVEVLTPQAFRFNRINGRWATQLYGRLLGRHSLHRPYSKKLEGKPVPKHLWPAEFQQPSAFLESMTGFPGQWYEEPISKTWACFFPDVPKREREVHSYAKPGTVEFWKSYAEPVKVFWTKGMELAKIHGAFRRVKSKWQEGGRSMDRFYSAFCRMSELFGREGEHDFTAEQADWDFIASRTNKQDLSDLGDIYLSLHRFSNLVASVRPALNLEKDGFRQRWQAESLLGALSMMMLQDFTGDLISRECPMDGNVFSVQGEHWTKYCSPKCAETGRKREQRARKKAKLTQKVRIC